MQSSKSTVLPLPVGAEITMFTSERKQAEKHSLCRELKYLHAEGVKHSKALSDCDELKKHFNSNKFKFCRFRCIAVFDWRSICIKVTR